MKTFKILLADHVRPIGVGIQIDEDAVLLKMSGEPSQIITRKTLDRVAGCFPQINCRIEWSE